MALSYPTAVIGYAGDRGAEGRARVSDRAPVQRESCGLHPHWCKAHPADDPRHKPGTIAWGEHVEAWADYAKRYGRDHTAERLAARGGFSYSELVDHLKHDPRTWEPA